MLFFSTPTQADKKTMPYDHPIVIEPKTPATHSLIVLHGLGADGHDFLSLSTELGLPNTLSMRFIFPHAPIRPITLNNGYPMRGWYDITSLTAEGREDKEGLLDSVHYINALIEQQIAAGLPSHRIFLMGFSQGCALSLTAGLRHTQPLAGIIALSGYLPLAQETLAIATNKNLPIFMAHGTEDNVVAYPYGKASYMTLRQAGYQPSWHEYAMPHTVCEEEIRDISQWIQTIAT